MKKEIIIEFLLMVSSVSAMYIDMRQPCKDRIDYEEFIYECPHNHRVDGLWLFSYNYLVNESLSYCENDVLIQNCTYEIVDWLHPNVTGSGPGIEETTHAPIEKKTNYVCTPGTRCLDDSMCNSDGQVCDAAGMCWDWCMAV